MSDSISLPAPIKEYVVWVRSIKLLLYVSYLWMNRLLDGCISFVFAPNRYSGCTADTQPR